MSDGIGTSWGPRGAWDDIIIERSFGAHVLTPGVIVHLLSPGVATLMLNSSNTRSKAGSRLPVDLPATGTAITGSNFDLVWIAPGQWLALSEEDGLAQRLQDLMGDGVAVADQTGARATARLSGTCVRKALAKGCPIDLDSRAFPLGSAAGTNIALIGVNVWTLPGEDAVYVSLFRSMAQSFWSWLKQSSAEFGISVRI